MSYKTKNGSLLECSNYENINILFGSADAHTTKPPRTLSNYKNNNEAIKITDLQNSSSGERSPWISTETTEFKSNGQNIKIITGGTFPLSSSRKNWLHIPICGKYASDINDARSTKYSIQKVDDTKIEIKQGNKSITTINADQRDGVLPKRLLVTLQAGGGAGTGRKKGSTYTTAGEGGGSGAFAVVIINIENTNYKWDLTVGNGGARSRDNIPLEGNGISDTGKGGMSGITMSYNNEKFGIECYGGNTDENDVAEQKVAGKIKQYNTTSIDGKQLCWILDTNDGTYGGAADNDGSNSEGKKIYLAVSNEWKTSIDKWANYSTNPKLLDMIITYTIKRGGYSRQGGGGGAAMDAAGLDGAAQDENAWAPPPSQIPIMKYEDANEDWDAFASYEYWGAGGGGSGVNTLKATTNIYGSYGGPGYITIEY